MNNKKILDITEDVKWIGALDPDLITFDVVMETKYGTTYNSYFIDAEKKALIETVKEKFELFNAKEFVSKRLKELYGGEVQADFGITLEKNDLELIESRLVAQTISHPEMVFEMQNKLKLHDQLPEDIKGQERRIIELSQDKSLTAKLEVLKKAKSSLEIVKEYKRASGDVSLALRGLSMEMKSAIKGLFGLITAADQIKERSLRNEYNTVKGVEKELGTKAVTDPDSFIHKIDVQIGLIQEKLTQFPELNERINQSKEQFANLRKELIGGVGEIVELKEAIQVKTKKGLEDLMKNPAKFVDLDSAQEKFDKLRAVKTTTLTGVNPLETVKEDELQKNIDKEMKDTIVVDILEVIMRSNFGEGALTRMERALEKFVAKKKLGSKEGQEVKELVINSIAEACINIGNTPEDKIKKLLCSQIIIKMQKK